MPVVVNEEMLADARRALPELPEAKRQRFMSQYGLPEYDAGVLVSQAAVAAFYEQAATGAKNPKTISNWVMTELLGKLGEAKKDIAESPVTPAHLAELVAAIEAGQISGKMGKDVFAEMFATGKGAAVIIREKGLVQVSDVGALEALADQVIAANAKSVADFKAGNEGALNFLKGQIMKLSKGKANPQLAGEILNRKLRG
jgi:aspartyl-tRNA(Asn)/glutamyl-tRNA(Gln) amidotransferase subunit B